MKTKLLVTTGLEKSWGTDEEILFLGEWCKPYPKYAQWSKRNFTVIDYHWRDRDKLQRDHEYLNDVVCKYNKQTNERCHSHYNWYSIN